MQQLLHLTQHGGNASRSAALLACAGKAYVDNELPSKVSSLCFSTLFAIVPIMAAITAIARGFGFDDYLLEQFRQFMASQPEAAEAIITFSNRYLANNQSYFIVGLGCLFMLYTIINLLRSVELIFNDIYLVDKPRPLRRMVVDYSALTLLFTLAAVLSAGLTAFVGGLADSIVTAWQLPPLARWLGPVIQVGVAWSAFVVLYTFMPHTTVPMRVASVPALLSAVAMVFFQYAYVSAQYFLSSYNTVYGSLAILPLFMIWLTTAWNICLFGAQLTSILWHGAAQTLQQDNEKLTPASEMQLLTALMVEVTRCNTQGENPTTVQLAQRTALTLHATYLMLQALEEAKMVHQVTTEDQEKHWAVGVDTAQTPLETVLNQLATTVGKRWNATPQQPKWLHQWQTTGTPTPPNDTTKTLAQWAQQEAETNG